MSLDLSITRHCFISKSKVIAHGKELYSQPESIDFTDFVTNLYHHLGLQYTKFFKMDSLSKLGFITSEILLQGRQITLDYKPVEIGIILSNYSSSLDTDTKFNDLIKDETNYFPSPAVFVYTLPNIMAGEISIRNQIKGETAFFIFEEFNPEFLHFYIENLFAKSKIKACMAGWVDLKDKDYESFLIFVENKEVSRGNSDETTFTKENLSSIYSKLHGRIN